MSDSLAARHIREHRSVLASAEKKALLWLAERIPGCIHSDHLTLLGLLAMAGAGAAYWASRWDDRALLLVAAALAVNWFGDSLDGTLARFRKRERPRYGYYVDHVIDLFGALFLLAGMAVSGYMTPLVGLGLLVGYLMLSAEIYLATCSHGVFRLSFWRLGPTELRILLAAGTVFLLYKPVVQLGSLGRFLLLDVAGVAGIFGLAVTLLVSATRNARHLYLEEKGGEMAADQACPKPAERAGAKPRVAALFWLGCAALAILPGNPLHAAELQDETLEAWSRYVSFTERRMLRESDLSVGRSGEMLKSLLSGRISVIELATLDEGGGEIPVPGGTINHWRGSMLIPGVSLEQVLEHLQDASRMSRQEDVLEARLLGRDGDRSRVFLKLQRSHIVTAAYNTEHLVEFSRRGPDRVTSRSIAVKIAELENAGTASEREKPVGRDRGFLWRLNSYWRYQQVQEGVLVECESLTLSRSIPFFLGFVAGPIVDRVARESLTRTLVSLRDQFSQIAWTR